MALQKPNAMTTMSTATYTPADAKLIVNTSEGLHFFKPQDIMRLESSSNYTYIHFTNRKPLLMAKVLKTYEALLAPMGFIRIHQSHIVNKQHICCIDAEGRVVLNDDCTLTISRRKRREVMQSLLRA